MPILCKVVGMHREDVNSGDIPPQILFLEPFQPKLMAQISHVSTSLTLHAFQSAFGKNYQTLRVGETVQFPQRDFGWHYGTLCELGSRHRFWQRPHH
jgi:AraC-like DNA-binding protein